MTTQKAVPPAPQKALAPRRRRLSLSWIAGVGAVLAGLLMCAIVGTILILHARSAVKAETDSAYQLATAAATLRLPTAFGREDIMAQALRLGAEIDGLRHVSAWVTDATGKRMALEPLPDATPPSAPRWLIHMLTPPPRSDIFPIRHYPNVVGILTIATDPSDEISKTWDTLRMILPLLALAVVGMVAVTMTVTLYVMRRLRVIEAAMARMRDNDLTVRAPASGFAELDALSDGVNALASHLDAGRAENRMLQERMLSLAEAERARIASDLHDEMGPQLFALRAAVGQAAHAARHLSLADETRFGGALDAISRHAQEVQKTARAAIEDLRPMTLDDAGLDELLHELILGFSESAPEIAFSLQADPPPRLGEAAQMAIYRFARESVLNAIRHAHPRRIQIEMSCTQNALLTRVMDDGSGPLNSARAGLGQSGMEDRALILGAVYTAPYRLNGQTLTELRMPL